MTIRSVPTLDDVAKQAAVSTATVSRCLNSPEQVSEATRNRVNEAVNALGYTPNFGARVMAAKRTNTIGAIIPTMENAIFARGLQAFQDELRTRGYTLLVASSSYKSDVEEEQVRALISRGADGLLLIGHDRSATIMNYLAARNVPALVAWAHNPGAVLPSIGFDNFEAMCALARQVMSLGHQRIGLISAATETNDRARARVLAVRHVMQEAGISPDNLHIIETEYGIETGATAFQALIDAGHDLSVVFCGNDVLAVGAIKQAQKMGINVPSDISITGFDDIEIARVVVPELCTVHVPHRKMGARAASILVDMVEGRAFPHTTQLDATVEIRGSLSAASAAR